MNNSAISPLEDIAREQVAKHAPAPLHAGGQSVHLSLYDNIRYRDREGSTGPQNDCATACALGDMPAQMVGALIDDALNKAETDVLALRRDAMRRQNGGFSPPSATLVLGAYDPRDMTLRLRSVGDSVMAMTVDDGERGGVLYLNRPWDASIVREGRRFLHHYLGKKKMLADYCEPDEQPVQRGTARFFNDCPEKDLPLGYDETTFVLNLPDAATPRNETLYEADPLPLKSLIEHARELFGLKQGKLSVSLIAASDCLTECPEILDQETGNSPLAALLAGRPVEALESLDYNADYSQPHPADAGNFDWAPPENLAARIGKALCQVGGRDNQGIIVLPDIEEGKGEPVLFAVSDGTGENSLAFASTAIGAVEHQAVEYRAMLALQASPETAVTAEMFSLMPTQETHEPARIAPPPPR